MDARDILSSGGALDGYSVGDASVSDADWDGDAREPSGADGRFSSQRSLNSMINGIPCGIAIVNCYADGRIEDAYVNSQCQKMISVGDGGLDAYNVLEVVHPDDRQGLINEIRASAREDRDGSFDFRILMADESVKWLNARSRAASKTDAMQTLYVVYTDIDSQRYEHELQLRKELTRDSEAYFQLNLTTDTVEEYSSSRTGEKRVVRSIPASAEFRKGLLRDVVARDRELVENGLFIEGLKRAYESGETGVSIDYRRVNSSGEICWLRGVAEVMKRPGTDEVIAFVHCHDITREKKDQLALESILEQDIEAVALLNVKTGRMRVVKTSGEETAEMPEEDAALHGENGGYRDIFSVSGLLRALEKEPFVSLTHRAKNARGEIRWKRTIAYYLDASRDDIVVSRRDITAIHEEEERQKLALRAALDEANSANNAKNEFISRMSHDMRTAMNAVVGLVRLLRNEDLPQRAVEHLNGIDSSSRFLSGLIQDILDIDGIGRGEVKFNEEPLSPDEFRRGVIPIVKPLMDEKGIDFSVDLAGFERAILIDRQRFYQIITHLLSNAAKYTSKGGSVKLRCQKIPEREGKLGLRFTVTDDGQGMSEEFQKVIFEPFTQQADSSRTQLRGSGLGLAVVKRLLSAMGGFISVKSELGAGSVFTADFYVSPAEPAGEEPSLTDTDYPSLEGLRVLIVEDNELNRRILEMLLERVGCVTEFAVNGLEATRMFAASGVYYYGAILMDIRMPVMDGLEATRRIRASGRPDSKTVPVISVTADVLSDTKDDPDKAGITARLMKPIDADKLFSTIERLAVYTRAE